MINEGTNVGITYDTLLLLWESLVDRKASLTQSYSITILIPYRTDTIESHCRD
jgi:hypothetical protein